MATQFYKVRRSFSENFNESQYRLKIFVGRCRTVIQDIAWVNGFPYSLTGSTGRGCREVLLLFFL